MSFPFILYRYNYPGGAECMVIMTSMKGGHGGYCRDAAHTSLRQRSELERRRGGAR